MEMRILKIKLFQSSFLSHWKFIFHIFLSVQLCLSSVPFYVQAAQANNEDDIETIKLVNQLEIEYDSGNLQSYLDEHPEDSRTLDRFFMFSQLVELVGYQLEDTEKGTVRKPFVKDTVQLNEYRQYPSSKRPTSLTAYYPQRPSQDPLLELHQEAENFYLEGKFGPDILFRHYIPELGHVIADTQSTPYEDPEFLALLDPKKGVYLIDKEIAPIVAGSAPIPIVPISLSLSEEDLLEMQSGLSMEFVRSIISIDEEEELREKFKKKTEAEIKAEINQYTLENTTKPFDIISDNAFRNHSSSEGSFVFQDGDLAVVYTNEQNQRVLVDYIPRAELNKRMYRAYRVIDLMITLRSTASLIIDPSQSERFQSLMEERGKQDKFTIARDNIYAVVLEEALHKLLPYHPYFQTREKLLIEDFSSHRFNLEEWRKLQPDEIQQEISPERRNWLVRNFQRLGRTGQWMKKTSLNFVGSLDKLVKGDFKGWKESVMDGWNDQPIKNLLLTALLFGMVAPETFVNLLSLGFSFTDNWNHFSGGRPYIQTMIYNIIIAGFGVLIAGGGLTHLLYKPLLKLRATTSSNLSKGNPFRPIFQFLEGKEIYREFQNVGQYELSLWNDFQEKQLKKYEKRSFFYRKLLEIGMQLFKVFRRGSAEVALPIQNRMATALMRIAGQPLVKESLSRGINPFTKIRNPSGGETHVRLGWTGWTNPIYSKRRNPLYNEHKKLQDEFLEKSKRIEEVAYLLAIVAVYNAENKDPDYIRTQKAVHYIKDIMTVLKTRRHRFKHQWVMSRLAREMKQEVDRINLSYGQDVDTQYIQDFYKRALELAVEYEETGYLQRRSDLYVNRQTLFDLNRGFWLAFQEKYDFLKSPSEMLEAERFLMETSLDHLIGKVIMLGFLERGSTQLGSIHEREYDPGSRGSSSLVGWADNGQNLWLHGFLGSALIAFGLRQNKDTLAQNHSDSIARAYPLTLPELDIEKNQRVGEYLGLQFSYPLLRFKGKNRNFGAVLRQRELGQWSMVQVLILSVLLPRWLSGELTFEQTVMASLVYNFAALPLYRMLWSWISGGAGINENILAQNYNKQRDLQRMFLSLSRSDGKTEEEYRSQYFQAFNDFIQLYDAKFRKSKQQKKLLEFLEKAAQGMPQDSRYVKFVKNGSFTEEDIRSLSLQSEITEILKVSEKMALTMVTDSPLPTQEHKGANWIFTSGAGPIATTLLAANLLIETWRPEMLTAQHLMMAFSAWSGILLLSNLYRKPFYLKDIGDNGKTMETWVDYFKRKKEAFKEEISDYRDYRRERPAIAEKRRQRELEEGRKPSKLRRFFRDTSGSLTMAKAAQRRTGESKKAPQNLVEPYIQKQDKRTTGKGRGIIDGCKNIVSRLQNK